MCRNLDIQLLALTYCLLKITIDILLSIPFSTNKYSLWNERHTTVHSWDPKRQILKYFRRQILKLTREPQKFRGKFMSDEAKFSNHGAVGRKCCDSV